MVDKALYRMARVSLKKTYSRRKLAVFASLLGLRDLLLDFLIPSLFFFKFVNEILKCDVTIQLQAIEHSDFNCLLCYAR